jgi:hypothetical protein
MLSIFLVLLGKASFLPAKCLPSWERRSHVPYTFQALGVAHQTLFVKILIANILLLLLISD